MRLLDRKVLNRSENKTKLCSIFIFTLGFILNLFFNCTLLIYKLQIFVNYSHLFKKFSEERLRLYILLRHLIAYVDFKILMFL